MCNGIIQARITAGKDSAVQLVSQQEPHFLGRCCETMLFLSQLSETLLHGIHEQKLYARRTKNDLNPGAKCIKAGFLIANKNTLENLRF